MFIKAETPLKDAIIDFVEIETPKGSFTVNWYKSFINRDSNNLFIECDFVEFDEVDAAGKLNMLIGGSVKCLQLFSAENVLENREFILRSIAFSEGNHTVWLRAGDSFEILHECDFELVSSKDMLEKGVEMSEMSGFTIERDGVQIELTKVELSSAYNYQEHIFDRKNVEFALEHDDYANSLDEETREQYIVDLADAVRRRMDKCDYDVDFFTDCLSEAKETVAKDWSIMEMASGAELAVENSKTNEAKRSETER